MIINDTFLNLRMPVDVQNTEIKRIKNAAIGSILFSVPSAANVDVEETLIKKADIRYSVRVGNNTAQFVKEA